MSIAPLLLRIVLAVVLGMPNLGPCVCAAAVATTDAAPTESPPCPLDHGDDAADTTDRQPKDGDDRPDGCGRGDCDCGGPCRTPVGLVGATLAAPSLPPLVIDHPDGPLRLAGTHPPPPTPPPILGF